MFGEHQISLEGSLGTFFLSGRRVMKKEEGSSGLPQIKDVVDGRRSFNTGGSSEVYSVTCPQVKIDRVQTRCRRWSNVEQGVFFTLGWS